MKILSLSYRESAYVQNSDSGGLKRGMCYEKETAEGYITFSLIIFSIS